MAARRRSAQRRPRRRRATTAFINVPYDAGYEPLYLAFIAGLSGFGLIPRATVEIPGSRRRLDRLLGLLRRCRYSFHDLSRVELDPGPPQTPRFNMPFELGLAVALQKTRPGTHEWFLFEAQSRRVWKSLSDLAGTDEYAHGGTPRGVLQALTNALVRSRHKPTIPELHEIYEDVTAYGAEIKTRLGVTDLFAARPFRELVVAARRSASRRVVSSRKRRAPAD